MAKTATLLLYLTVTSELRPLLECFANGHSMDVIFVAANMLIDDGNNDGALGEWFRSLNSQGAPSGGIRPLLTNASSTQTNHRICIRSLITAINNIKTKPMESLPP